MKTFSIYVSSDENGNKGMHRLDITFNAENIDDAVLELERILKQPKE